MENNEKKITFQNNFKNSTYLLPNISHRLSVNSDFGNKDDFLELIYCLNS